MAAAEAWIDRRLLLGVLDRDRALDDPGERGLQPAQGLAEAPVDAADPARVGAALHLDYVLVEGVAAHVVATSVAVTSTFTVASGSRTFQPRNISWS